MRRIAGATLASLALFGAYKLYDFLFYTLGSSREHLQRGLFGIGFAGVPLSSSLVGATALLALSIYLSWEFLSNHPKTVDFLIDTELEMKKVSWPSWDELKGSAWVVVLTVIFMGAYLFAVDVVLSKLVESVIGV